MQAKLNPHNANVRQQRGVSLVGMIFVLAILGFIGVIAMRVVPTYTEYRAIKNTIEGLKGLGSVREIQQEFSRRSTVAYIESIKGTDLTVLKNGSEWEISFAYEKKLPLFGNASLLLEYAGSTNPNAVPVVAETPAK